MASRKSVYTFIPKYFMAVRNCIHILVLYYRPVDPGSSVGTS